MGLAVPRGPHATLNQSWTWVRQALRLSGLPVAAPARMARTGKAKRKRDASSSEDDGDDVMAQRLAAYGARVSGVLGRVCALGFPRPLLPLNRHLTPL